MSDDFTKDMARLESKIHLLFQDILQVFGFLSSCSQLIVHFTQKAFKDLCCVCVARQGDCAPYLL